MALALKPLGKALGTEVVGMNVAEKLEPATLQWIERAFEEREPMMFGLSLEGYLRFNRLRGHPRFERLLHRIGLTHHDIARQQQLLRET